MKWECYGYTLTPQHLLGIWWGRCFWSWVLLMGDPWRWPCALLAPAEYSAQSRPSTCHWWAFHTFRGDGNECHTRRPWRRPSPQITPRYPDSPLLASIDGFCIHFLIKLCYVVLEAAIVSKGPPFHIDTHSALVPLHSAHIPHLLHVAGIGTRTWEKGMEMNHWWKWTVIFLPALSKESIGIKPGGRTISPLGGPFQMSKLQRKVYLSGSNPDSGYRSPKEGNSFKKKSGGGHLPLEIYSLGNV